MYMNAYHKVQGEVRMFEVDARNAIARFPEEWAAEPWLADPEDGAENNTPKRGRTRKAESTQSEGERDDLDDEA